MKRSLCYLTVAVLAISCSAPLTHAQTAAGDTSRLLAATQLNGTDVQNLQKEHIGDIDEVLIDPGSGRVRFVVLSVGGFLGLGDTNVAVPWEAFRVTRDGEQTRYALDASKERLEKAPRVEGKRYDRLYSRQDAEPSFIYWGVTWWDLGASTSPSPGASPGASPKSSPTVSPPMRPGTSPSPSPKKK